MRKLIDWRRDDDQGHGRCVKVVEVAQWWFDEEEFAREPAREHSGDTDAVLESRGYDRRTIFEMKVSGAVL